MTTPMGKHSAASVSVVLSLTRSVALGVNYIYVLTKYVLNIFKTICFKYMF